MIGRALLQQPSLTQIKPHLRLDPDLALYLPFWNMPDGQTYLSQDAYGQTVTRFGATPTGQGYWDFDGVSNYVSLGTTFSGFEGRNACTVCAWVKPRTISNDPILGIFGAGGSSDVINFLLLDNPSENLYFSLFTSSQATITSNKQISLNVWTWVAGRYDGVVLNLFVNNEQDTAAGTLTGNLTKQVAASEYVVGKYHDGTLLYDGGVGELWLFGKALTAEEIEKLRVSTAWRFT